MYLCLLIVSKPYDKINITFSSSFIFIIIITFVAFIQVAIIKDEVPNIFKRSPRAKKLFPDMEASTCAAVSLARFAQEPLIEYCALWLSVDSMEQFGYESLYLDLHPLKVRERNYE